MDRGGVRPLRRKLELFGEPRLKGLFPTCQSSGPFVPVTLTRVWTWQTSRFTGDAAPGPGESRAAWNLRKVPSLLPSWAGEAGAKLRFPHSYQATLDFLRLCLERGAFFLTGRCVLYLHAGLSLCPHSCTQRQGEGRSPPTSCLFADPHMSPGKSQLWVWRACGALWGVEGDSKWLSLTSKISFYNFSFKHFISDTYFSVEAD